MKRSKFVILTVAALFLVAIVSMSAQAQAPEAGQKGPPPGTPKEGPYAKPYPMGFVTIDITAVGVGVGVQWGKGVLNYKGKQYTFKVKGMQLASVGISKVSAKGEVYNLFSIAEFPGQYAAIGAGATFIKGKEGQTFENHKGVKIVLSGTPKGLNLNIGPEGFYIEMERAM
ncbi:MAG: hypothetical protein WC450_12215 [Candidatus Omnitrophota bacterium]|jgi:hypothetical protein